MTRAGPTRERKTFHLVSRGWLSRFAMAFIRYSQGAALSFAKRIEQRGNFNFI